MYKPSKRRRVDTNSYHDRIDLTDDYEVIHTRETRRIEHGRFLRDTPRDPLKGRTTWTAPDVSWVPEDNPEFTLDPDGNWYDAELSAPIADTSAFQDAPTPVRLKKKKTLRSKWPHAFWKQNYRSQYLDEILRWEGRGDLREEQQCSDCLAWKVESACCVRRHKTHPFHVIESWNGNYFLKVSLKDLGLTVQLQHVTVLNSPPGIPTGIRRTPGIPL
ncbi:hypothetical protein K443DRAFT_15097 [Laccaria amethystina LaAM-08-1]|uniref:Uncharacterized protein n=1 Tax=Laccaria amethystina LaAM-08-1 TaxID=1095629 RepID=A0A0C9WZ18_9AGAR|nr:hypothetical protein K443DRAFT_15097 [Laccaria amethystina LaAM-08-1]